MWLCRDDLRSDNKGMVKMKKRINYIGLFALLTLLLCMLGGCKEKEAEEVAVQATEISSEPGRLLFTFPEGWTVSTYEEGSSAEVRYDFVAEDVVTGSGISLLYDDLNRIQGGNLIRMEDYLAAFQENLKLSGNHKYSCSEVTETELLGEVYYTFSAAVAKPQLTHQFYLRRIEDKVMVMTVTLAGEDSLENLLNYCTSL